MADLGPDEQMRAARQIAQVVAELAG
jgi:hypothetical protein